MTHGWPQMMRKPTALAYLDLSDAAFEREIAAGRLPAGVMFGKRLHWYKAALDRALAMIAGERPDHYEQEFWNRGKAA